MIHVLLDTNVILKAAIDLYQEKESRETQIIQLAEEGRVTLLLNLTLLEEYHRVAKRLLGRDFAGWFRNSLLKTLPSVFIDETILESVIAHLNLEIPGEDLPHFATLIVAGGDILISHNREFIQKAANAQKAFRCFAPDEFLTWFVEEYSGKERE
ncbi:MAG: PIN domain-containing protein [Candidatus Heimdallarchaeota archaeon]